MELAPIPPADRDRLQAFLEEHLLGGEPVSDLAEELADVSSEGLAALNAQIGAFLGTDSPMSPASSRAGLLSNLAQLLDSAELLDSHQSSPGKVTIAPSRPDDRVANDALRAASPRQMEMVAKEKGAGRITNVTLRAMRGQVGWMSLNQFFATHDYKNYEVIKEVAQRCRERKLAEYQGQGVDSATAEKRVQQEYIAVTHHLGPRHKRDPYDASPRRVFIDLSPEAIGDMEAELARHPAVQRWERTKAGWVSGTSVMAKFGYHSNAPATPFLICRMRKCAALQDEGLSPTTIEERVQSEYMAFHTVSGPGKKERTTLDVSPEAAADIEALMQERGLGLAAREPRTPGWWPSGSAAGALGHDVKTIYSWAGQLRTEKIAHYQAQGAGPEEAEDRVQKEYIARRYIRYANGSTGKHEIDLSPAAFRDLATRAVAHASWQSCEKLSRRLQRRPETILKHALQCRANKLEEYAAQGHTAKEAEEHVQHKYIAIKPSGTRSKIEISPQACDDIAASIDRPRGRKRAMQQVEAGERNR